MTLLITLLAFVFTLGAAVIIHEFGHFIVAKLLGIRVEAFSVGFGPRIFGWRWGTTDYRLSAIPLGGFVKLGGDESNAPIEGESVSDIPLRERFDLRPRWQKFMVIIAGPVMNILTALMIPFVAALLYGVPATVSPVVSRIAPNGAADIAKLQPGDRIVSFNNHDNPTWSRINDYALLAPGQTMPLVVERDGQRIPLEIKPTPRNERGETVGDLGFQPDSAVTIGSVEANSPAAEAGLKPDDRVVAINGEPMLRDEQVVLYIQDHKAEPLTLVVERAGERLQVETRARQMADGKERLGIRFGGGPLERVGLVGAASYAVEHNLRFIRLTAVALGQIFQGQRSARDSLAGPIGIGRAAGTAANEGGWEGVFWFLGFLSLNLGVFNLLPIPVLDGGAIFLLFIEAVLGVVGITLSITIRERIQQLGFVTLLLLMGFVIFNDLAKEASLWRNSSKDRPAATASPSPQPQQR